jgi:hypothetical protein
MKINNHLTLLQEETPKNWALVIEGNAPTIEQYKRKPELYNTIPHGLYRIDVEINDTWATDEGIRIANGLGIKIMMNTRQTIHHIAKGNVVISGNMMTVFGRFDKQGREIFFRPGK